MGDRKLKPRKGADFPQVTQLVGLRAGARSQALPPNTYFVMFSEPGGAWEPPELPGYTCIHLVGCHWAGAAPDTTGPLPTWAALGLCALGLH